MPRAAKSRYPSLFQTESPHPSSLLSSTLPQYSTSQGAAYVGDGLKLMGCLPDGCVDLVVTSPPYALHFKKEYGNVDKQDYVQWFLPFARAIKRVLSPRGSFVLNIGGSYNPGQPTRSLYHFKLLIALCDELNFFLAQECFWFNPAKLPTPAEWVNVRRCRIKDSVEYIWWFAVTPWPNADNKQVLVRYSADMERLLVKGYVAKRRPSGHVITAKFRRNHGGSIPSNLLERGNNESNSEYIRACKESGQKAHPARFPAALPEFFIKFLTNRGALILDPFAGSNTVGRVCEDLDRRWLSMELESEYVVNSRLRFRPDEILHTRP